MPNEELETGENENFCNPLTAFIIKRSPILEVVGNLQLWLSLWNFCVKNELWCEERWS